MSWTLETPDGRSLHVNAWNWRPTLELLESSGVVDAETAELLGYNISVDLSGEDAQRIATFLEGHLAAIPADGRVLLDGSVTTEPDTFAFHRDDLARNYSATAEWLARFRDFCRSATEGFTAC
ncbi:hypothetical protein SAMN05444920_103869 [Nonomuraea solani]|uniref:Uncharacterized protein n=1 Tax=Nonomuraea solani TaxID=1144553 RepID=A0A1H6C450_9ACTN|nr:hypothetical protein [Nonomuraea solani]SEG67405.1 hypothetical protein SAMN05444920_103869 [Nonomuraea solani]